MTKSKNFYGWILGFILVLAFLLRILVFSYRDSFEDDECRILLAFLDKSWWQMFLSLGEAQQAPPFFIVFMRIWGNIFSYNERCLKIVPLFMSFATIILFYKLSIKFLHNKFSILIANFLFAINIKLITFSSIIKQYTGDVLLALICCLIFHKLDIVELSKKKLVILGIFLLALPLMSLPSLFFIAALFVTNWLKNMKNKEFYIRSLLLLTPFVINLVLYYIFNLAPSKQSFDLLYPHSWDYGLIGFSLKNFIAMHKLVINFLFFPNIYVLFAIIIFYFGIFCACKDKQITLLSSFINCVLLFALFASMLKLYPLEGRVALYLTPFLILLFVKPFDRFQVKNYIIYLYIIFFVFAFCNYNFNYFINITTNSNVFINYSPKLLMQTLIKKFDPKTDIVLCNEASASSYLFYSSLYKFKNDEIFKLGLNHRNTKEENLEILNQTKKNQNYWFYLIKDFRKTPNYPIILEWVYSQNVLYELHDRNSHLILMRRL